ncbi:aminoacyl-histidine dipeptidase [Sphingomonas sp. LH128]|uniref:Aminoacyl-histidine dipeptidase n=1 Tax=Novosphingobium resinovorum TaxID=158500 RepID=A0A031JLD6_9SPHN|nr:MULTISPECIES: M20/M25/M40 family metallo-hydrolase [Sphingomonadaceae]EJU10941.1 aminoacyl-histidine dipeptidase [Sphingomonas sp. LH128]EZP75630.1 Aminoacyl-histidine dipeptidase [Novosphingobium resinovorum]
MPFAMAILAAAAAAPAPAKPATPPVVERVIATSSFKAAAQSLRADHERFVDEIIRITQTPSPPFGEAERGRLVAQMMRDSGFRSVSIDEVGNVIGLRPGRDARLPPLVVAAHLDTVFPKGTDVTVKREGTKLRAPGIGDDSRGVATLLVLARAMDKAGIQTDRDVLFVGNVGEEGPGDLRGMRHLFSTNARARAAAGFISIDSSGSGGIVTRGVGSNRYHIVFSGPGGHSYDKFGIVNPMVPLAKTVTGLYQIAVPATPKVTYSASVVGGGTSVNTIPPQVFLDVDMRSISPEEVARVDAELRAIAQKAVDEENAARSTARGKVSVDFQVIGKRPAGHTDETKGIAAIAFGTAEAFGYEGRFIEVSTDANVPMSLGIPAITIGSGGTGGAEHSPDEWIDVALEPSVKGLTVDLATIIAAAGAKP